MTLNKRNRILKLNDLRHCSSCDRDLPISLFGRKTERSLRTSCNPCRLQGLLILHPNPERARASARRLASRARAEAMQAYGRVCACCGESNDRYLTLDHINGCGSARRQRERGGSRLYLYLKRRGFPQGDFRVLCFNCNCGRREHFLCPPGSHANQLVRTA